MDKLKDFLKQKLNLILESYPSEQRYATKKDYYQTLFKITRVKKLYGGDEYWENVEAGDFIGAAIVDLFGNVRVRTNTASAGDIKNTRLGIMSEKPFYITFQVMAGRGIQHPNTFSEPNHIAQTRQGIYSQPEEKEETLTFELPQGVKLENGDTHVQIILPKAGSPASDAQIKTYLIYGDVILDFVEKNMKNPIGYMDTKGAQISKKKMTTKQANHKEKKDLEHELGRRITDTEWNLYVKDGIKPQPRKILTLDPQKAAEFEKRQELLRAKYNKLKK